MVRSYYLYDKSISFLYEVYKIPPPLLGLHIKFQTFLVSDLKRSLASKFGLVELSPPHSPPPPPPLCLFPSQF